jgi:Tol biopolymer transport system component
VKALALSCVLLLTASGAATAASAGGPPARYQLALVDLDGKRQVLGTLPDSVFAPRLSPDGKQVAFELADAASATEPAPVRLYVAPLHRLEQRRALPLVGERQNWAAVWSTDGKRLVFDVSENGSDGGHDALYWRRADGVGDAEHLIDARACEGLYDGDRKLAFITLTGHRDYGISLLDMKTKAVTRLIDYPGSEQHSSRIAHNGRWIAYVSNETGRQEVWLEPLPQTGARYRITQDGGRHPMWSPDDAKLYFDQGGQMFQVELALAGVPSISQPKGLAISGFHQGDLRRQFDLMPSGKQFLMLFPLP